MNPAIQFAAASLGFNDLEGKSEAEASEDVFWGTLEQADSELSAIADRVVEKDACLGAAIEGIRTRLCAARELWWAAHGELSCSRYGFDGALDGARRKEQEQ